VAARSKAWFCGQSLEGIAGSNPTVGIGVCLFSVLCVVQVQVSASGLSLVQRSLTDWGVSECDREASIIRRPWPISGSCTIKKKELIIHAPPHNKQQSFAKTIRSVLCSKMRCSIPDNSKNLKNYTILVRMVCWVVSWSWCLMFDTCFGSFIFF
jgi:hypothetical protein